MRKAGIHAETDYAARGLKSQMKGADRLKAARTLIVGEDEIEKGKGVLRDMKTKEQTEIDLDNLVSSLKDIQTKDCDRG